MMKVSNSKELIVMATPIDLSNCATAEQQVFMALEHLADLQRSETDNPDNETALTASSHDDIQGIYTFAGSLDYETVANEVNGTVEAKVVPMFALP